MSITKSRSVRASIVTGGILAAVTASAGASTIPLWAAWAVVTVAAVVEARR